MQIRFLFPLVFFLLIGHWAEAQSSGTIIVNVHHQGAEKGFIMLALYAREEGFPSNPKKAILQLKQVTKSKITTIRMDAVPFGNYAIAVFHDENSDGKINYNLVGAPTEAYGFSNNARKMFSAPSFGEAMFRHASESTIRINIK